MLQHADKLPDSDEVRRRAHGLSANGQRHIDEANRLDPDAGR